MSNPVCRRRLSVRIAHSFELEDCLWISISLGQERNIAPGILCQQ
jgi:hypothetical protein